MSSFHDLPPGRLGDALDAAITQAVRSPPAHETIFKYPGLIEVNWERAASCHHSNVPLVGSIGAMIDPVASAGALQGVRLVTIVGEVSRLDEVQCAILAAAAGRPGAERTPRVYFRSAVLNLIEAEQLEDYFEVSVSVGAGHGDFGIRPAGHAESERDDRTAFAKGVDPVPRDLFTEIRQLAHIRRLDPARRVALVSIMALYNDYDAGQAFKGRGWVLTARELGEYLRDRADSRPAAFDALLLAMATYHGW